MKSHTPPPNLSEWMIKASDQVDATLHRHGISLTLGGEPTFIPINPEGPEWSYSAVGPTKFLYAQQIAEILVKGPLKDSAVFFCPGKSYPGEVNPRWALRILANRDGSPLFSLRAHGKSLSSLKALGAAISKHLGVKPHWLNFADTRNSENDVIAALLDFTDGQWVSEAWPLSKKERELTKAEGPAGLRLPLHHLPSHITKRALTLEWEGDAPAVFFPPLLQEPFLKLLNAIQKAADDLSLSDIHLQGYTAHDEGNLWTTLGLTADPGVLEINLPPCSNWQQYAYWVTEITQACESAGMRSWKETPWNPPEGTGGGNHLIWGGPTLDSNPFFTRPGWLARILRKWQQHPSLAYLFTGCYVGASSQAPRPDESSRDLYDIEMAYRFLESLPEGDHRELINETLRHIHTDVTGNSHRSEVSFDKFWNTSWSGGALGLIEFRAIETFPRAEWMAGIALLWSCLAAQALETAPPKSFKRFGSRLRDEFFLPSALKYDLDQILQELREAGFPLEDSLYHDIWAWRFPETLSWHHGKATLSVRKALESWPLLCETPVEGGSTSRFVDTSMHRLEFLVNEEFNANYEVHVAGRLLPLKEYQSVGWLAGLRYRRTNLYPSLHPGIPVQMPLTVTLVEKNSHRIVAEFSMGSNDRNFHRVEKPGQGHLSGPPCRGGRSSDLTFDLRLGA